MRARRLPNVVSHTIQAVNTIERSGTDGLNSTNITPGFPENFLLPQQDAAMFACRCSGSGFKRNDTDGSFGLRTLSSSGNSTRQAGGKEPFDDGFL